jgi:hypothetical protein
MSETNAPDGLEIGQVDVRQWRPGPQMDELPLRIPKMLDDLLSVQVRSEVARWIVARMGIGHVPRQHTTKSR